MNKDKLQRYAQALRCKPAQTFTWTCKCSSVIGEPWSGQQKAQLAESMLDIGRMASNGAAVPLIEYDDREVRLRLSPVETTTMGAQAAAYAEWACSGPRVMLSRLLFLSRGLWVWHREDMIALLEAWYVNQEKLQVRDQIADRIDSAVNEAARINPNIKL